MFVSEPGNKWSPTNLNRQRGPAGNQQQDHSAHAMPAWPVHAHFKGLDAALMDYIREADYVVGCLAWFTHRGIIGDLARKRGVSLVVQKEDFLRPDLHSYKKRRGTAWKNELRILYASLPGRICRCVADPETTMHHRLDAVRCVGYSTEKDRNRPLMHHKFMVFCKPGDGRIDPYAVWTGSFNPTANGTRSLENALFVRDPVVAGAYYDEWAQVLALSEPLDWKSEYCTPDWKGEM